MNLVDKIQTKLADDQFHREVDTAFGILSWLFVALTVGLFL